MVPPYLMLCSDLLAAQLIPTGELNAPVTTFSNQQQEHITL
jgi:hypothetical protein